MKKSKTASRIKETPKKPDNIQIVKKIIFFTINAVAVGEDTSEPNSFANILMNIAVCDAKKKTKRKKHFCNLENFFKIFFVREYILFRDVALYEISSESAEKKLEINLCHW